MITEKGIYQVKDWNAKKRADKQYMQIYTLDNGSMIDEPRKNGYVVQKRHSEGGERSKFHASHEKAKEDYWSNKF